MLQEREEEIEKGDGKEGKEGEKVGDYRGAINELKHKASPHRTPVAVFKRKLPWRAPNKLNQTPPHQTPQSPFSSEDYPGAPQTNSKKQQEPNKQPERRTRTRRRKKKAHTNKPNTRHKKTPNTKNTSALAPRHRWSSSSS